MLWMEHETSARTEPGDREKCKYVWSLMVEICTLFVLHVRILVVYGRNFVYAVLQCRYCVSLARAALSLLLPRLVEVRNFISHR